MNFWQIAFPSAAAAFALLYLFLGAKGLMTKQAFWVHSRWLVLPLAVYFLLQSGSQISYLFDDRLPSDTRTVLLMFAIMPILFIGFFWWILRGIIIYGISEDGVSDAVDQILPKIGEEYEKKFSKVIFPKINTELSLNIQGWLGTANIRSKNSSMMKKVGLELTQVLPAIATKNAVHWFNMIMGVIMAILTAGMIYLFR
jgi:hypothetical protein